MTMPSSHPPRRVLVVDDDEDTATLLAELLRLEGHEVLTTHGARAALARWAEFDPDFALIDLLMPDQNGMDLVRTVLEEFPESHCHMVAMTGFGHDTIIEAALDAGFDEHLLKPTEFERLQEILRSSPVREPRE